MWAHHWLLPKRLMSSGAPSVTKHQAQAVPAQLWQWGQPVPQPLPAWAALRASAQQGPERESSPREGGKTGQETLERIHGRRNCWKRANGAAEGGWILCWAFSVLKTNFSKLVAAGLLHVGCFLNLPQPVSLTHCLILTHLSDGN